VSSFSLRMTSPHILKHYRCSVYTIYSLYHPIYCNYLKTDNHNVLWTVPANQKPPFCYKAAVQPQAPFLQNKLLERAIISIRNARCPVTSFSSPSPPPPPKTPLQSSATTCIPAEGRLLCIIKGRLGRESWENLMHQSSTKLGKWDHDMQQDMLWTLRFCATC
jgi:hypothetical protein